MAKHTHLISFAAGAAVCVTLGLGLAQPESISEKLEELVEQPEMPDMDAIYAEMAAKASPGEHHAELDKLIGHWHNKASFQMPGAEPMESEGTSHSKWILDGRFVQTDFRGDFMGEPFTGMAVSGYDQYRNQYVGMWIDTWSTAMYTSTGQMSEDGTLSMSGMNVSPMGESEMRMETSFVNDDKFIDTFFEKGPDGEWMQHGTIIYTRSKGKDKKGG